ncbi:VanZ family protein [Thalassotalea sp. LPB0316]|nr:VanZ family protein [Thalassotalea sp. LPB0316]
MFSHCINFVRQHWQALTLLIMALIAVASLYPAEHLPRVPGTDKTHHFIAYGLLALPVGLARPTKFWLYITILVTFGGLIELLQPFVNRYGEWLDVAANCAGILVGLLLATIMTAVANKIKPTK